MRIAFLKESWNVYAIKSAIVAKKAKTFTQRRPVSGTKVSQRKTLRVLCVFASLRALLIFFLGCGSLCNQSKSSPSCHSGGILLFPATLWN